MVERKKITCSFVAAVAASFLGGCSQSPSPQALPVASNQQWQLCVDRNGNVVRDENCVGQATRTAHSGGFMPYYWFYTRGMAPPAMGSSVQGLQGSTMPPPGGAALRSSQYSPSARPVTTSTQRGLFGSTGSGRSVYS